MNNLFVRLKRFISNKNTVTILCVFAGVAVLIFGYMWRVKQAVNPVNVPIALVRMAPKTKVEADNVGTIKVSGAFVEQTEDLIDSKQYILNNDWYVNYDTVIPEGGLFYKSQLVTKDQIPDTAWDDIPDGATVFSLTVDRTSTYGNSIMPGNFIDLYIKTVDEDGKIVFGKFIESIKVLAVKNDFNDVFADSQAKQDASQLIFAVQNDLFLLLSNASFVGSIQIVPVPRNAAYRQEGEGGELGTKVTREELMDLILKQVSELSDDINTGTLTEGNANTTTGTMASDEPTDQNTNNNNDNNNNNNNNNNQSNGTINIQN